MQQQLHITSIVISRTEITASNIPKRTIASVTKAVTKPVPNTTRFLRTDIFNNLKNICFHIIPLNYRRTLILEFGQGFSTTILAAI